MTNGLGFKMFELTESCFKWCQEQYANHERNLDINDQSFIIIALIAMVLYNIISSNWEKIISNTSIDENKLEKLHEGLHLTAFVMLIANLIYIIIQ